MAKIKSPPPTFVKFDIKDLVERLDPKHHDPDPSYQFSNNRRFVKKKEYNP